MSSSPAGRDKKAIRAWVLYDWANSAFATTVMAGFFPIFFKEYWNKGVDPTVSTDRLGMTNALAGLAVAILAPTLGAVADRAGNKKGFLGVFTLLGIACTALLPMVPQDLWLWAALCFGIAVVGFSGGIIFYDALLVDVSSREERDWVSAMGFSIGYLGGGVLFALNVAMVLKPGWFFLPDKAAAVRWSFLTVALWWGLFCLPLFRRVKERRPDNPIPGLKALGAGWQQLLGTFRKARKLKWVFWFLVAYWLYIDGIHTIIRMAVDYGMSIGMDTGTLLACLLVTQLVGFPMALLFGRLGRTFGPKGPILVALLGYIGICLWGSRINEGWEFLTLAAAIGFFQGGVQSLSRSMYSRLIPQDKAGEFFGFYNMLGKFAAVLGPLVMGKVALLTGNPRMGLMAIAIFFILGGGLLLFIPQNATSPVEA